jgi:hypothetical protein
LGRACGKKKEMGQKGRKMVGRQGEMNQARKERERREARVGLGFFCFLFIKTFEFKTFSVLNLKQR